MKKYKYFIVVQIFLIGMYFTFAHTQTEEPKRYFPSAIGDKWKWQNNFNDSTRIDEITKDSIDLDGNKCLFFNGDNYPLYKIDSLNQVYFLSKKFNSSGQIIGLDPYLWYKLDAQVGDSFLTMNGSIKVKVTSYASTLFGKETFVKVFTRYLSSSNSPVAYYYLARDFGPIHNIVIESDASGDEEITGCIINGIGFGSLTSVSLMGISLAASFQVFPNYPNPFNPSTNISFCLANDSNVRVIIQNVLGQFMCSLYEGHLQAGKYSVNWNAINNSSGIYLCTVKSEEVSKTIKLILLK